METVLLLFLLALSDKDDSLKRSLNQFLGFYKENRELIQMLLGSQKQGEPAATPEEGHEESRPREEVGNLNILEEYLRRVNA